MRTVEGEDGKGKTKNTMAIVSGLTQRMKVLQIAEKS